MTYSLFFTEPFKKKLRKLKKRYRLVGDDLKGVLADLETGKLKGKAIPESDNRIWKLRIPSSDMKRGKSGGFRIIYYLDGKQSNLYLLTIYAKARKENISMKEIKGIIAEIEISSE